MQDALTTELLGLLKDMSTTIKQLSADQLAARAALLAVISTHPDRTALFAQYEEYMAPAREAPEFSAHMVYAENPYRWVLMKK